MNHSHRILAIDDDPLTLHIVEHMLQKHGYEVFTAGNGHHGLELARVLKPDLVILDIMMPGLDGFQVCRKLRENPETAVITVLMLTARGADRQTGQRPGGFCPAGARPA
ncbi:response regulator [Candidatus Amarobacter glycogenicus]|uniref:response regulator n=1 Tax=Candidatus Amarobacter glycogenicus TaxID=3140699 RepID=UPI002A0AAA06|nr:response regulator [Dehalococcoidia bacterium]